MDNKYFDKKFKDKLERLPEGDFPFDDAAWGDVESVLNSENILPPQSGNWKKIIPFTIIGLLLLSNIFVSWKYYIVEKEVVISKIKITELEDELLVAQQAISTTTDANDANINLTDISENTPISDDNRDELTDNVPSTNTSPVVAPKVIERIVEKVVYVPQPNYSALTHADFTNSNIFKINITEPLSYPTLLNYNALDQQNPAITTPRLSSKMQNNSSFEFSDAWTQNLNTSPTVSEILNNDIADNNSNDSNSNKNDGGNIDNNPPSDVISDNSNHADDALAEKQRNEKLLKEALAKDAFENLESIDIENIKRPIVKINSQVEVDTNMITVGKNDLADRLMMMRYSMAVTNYSLGLSSGYDFLYQTSDFSISGTRVGLTGELSFSDRVKLGTTIEWKETSSKLEDIMDNTYPDTYFDIFPDISAFKLNPDDELNTIETRERAFEATLLAKYYLIPRNRLTPYFGGGVRLQYDFEQRFEYKYLVSPNFALEYEDYLYPTQRIFGVNTWMAMLGAEYDLTAHFSVRADFSYNQDFKTHRFNNTQYSWLSGNIGVLYNFK